MLGALDLLHGTATEYRGFLSNHGPMAADAMIRLGGGDRVHRWVDLYRLELEPAPAPGDAVKVEDWQRHLGSFELVGDWTSFFERAIDADGWRHVLAAWWPRLLPGAAASATHGLLRTAHAVRNLDETDIDEPLFLGELVAGLGLWAARYQELPGAPQLRGPLELGAAVAHLPRLDPRAPSDGPGLGGRLRALASLDGFPVALDAWGTELDPANALDHLIGHTARILFTRPESSIAFCHAVTAPAAVRMILDTIPPEHHRATVAACWQLAGAIVAAFAQPPDPPVPSSPATVPASELAAAAIDHGDDHVLKLTEACIRQFGITEDRHLLAAAESFRSRIPPRW
jgi:hypothetical protein